MSAARAGAEAEGARGTERGLLAHCHLGGAATTAAWSLRPRPPPPSHPSPLAPSPSSWRGPSPSRRPSRAASHRASIIYVTSTPSPPPPSPLLPLPGLGRCALSSLQLLRSRGFSAAHKSRDTWRARPPRAARGSVPLPRERPATLAAHGAKAGLHPPSLPQGCPGVRDRPLGKLRLPHASRRLCGGEMLRGARSLGRSEAERREQFGLLSLPFHPPCRVLVLPLVRELGKQSASLCSSWFFFRKRQSVDLGISFCLEGMVLLYKAP